MQTKFKEVINYFKTIIPDNISLIYGLPLDKDKFLIMHNRKPIAYIRIQFPDGKYYIIGFNIPYISGFKFKEHYLEYILQNVLIIYKTLYSLNTDEKIKLLDELTLLFNRHCIYKDSLNKLLIKYKLNASNR